MSDGTEHQMTAARALLPTPPGTDRPRRHTGTVAFALFLIALSVYFFRVFDEQGRTERHGGGPARSASPQKAP